MNVQATARGRGFGMSLVHAPEGFSWRAHGRIDGVPERQESDPPVIVWRKGKRHFVVDDETCQVDIEGLSETEVIAALYFANAMGWLAAPVFEIRDLPN